MKNPKGNSIVQSKKYKIAILSLHGLIRGNDLELGRDADTGGQTKYVVELLRALSKHENVEQVDLITRQIIDPKVSEDYAQIEEKLNDKARILRIPFGPKRYLRKEILWNHLDSFVDQLIHHYRREGFLPDIIHGHYADAGYAGAQIARILGVPFLFTGHSLGRVKKSRLLEGGVSEEKLENLYRISTRIEAEETSLDAANLVITSTRQEIQEQYEIYERYQPSRMEIVPPGVDMDSMNEMLKTPLAEHSILNDLESFLDEPEKPPILAIARADERKNLVSLVEAFGQNQALQKKANLVIVAGNRDNLFEEDKGKQKVISDLLITIDKYDLYGKVAYPKKHEAHEIPHIYRWAARRKGVFANPAFTEPFGLTLLEAASQGLPIVATDDGGPRDIMEICKNGELIDPLNTQSISDALLRILSDSEKWDMYAENGKHGVETTFSWSAHANKYMEQIKEVAEGRRHDRFIPIMKSEKYKVFDRIIITDIDNTLLGDEYALGVFLERLNSLPDRVGFGIATGRPFGDALNVLEQNQIPRPDFVISSVGTEIYHGPDLVEDKSWKKRIDYEWKPEKIREVFESIPGISPQGEDFQSEFKISYLIDSKSAPKVAQLKRLLRENGVRARLVCSLGMYLDITPLRSGDGLAIRHLAYRWDVPPEKLLVVGDSGNDEEMLKGETLGVVVANHGQELEKLRRFDRIYFSDKSHAWGILDGMEHYRFLHDIVPEMANLELEAYS